MLIDRSHLSWALFSGISLIAGAVSYVAYAWNSPKGPSGGSAIGLLFGVIGTLMMLFAGLLAARKPLRIRRIGSAQFWLKGHLWLGTLCIPFILFHAGFGWGGLLEQIMWYSLAIVAVSGFFGLAIQQFLPRLLSNRTPLETFEAQTPYQCDRMIFIADLRVAGLYESPLEVPPGHLREHFARLVTGYDFIVNGPGARNEQNAKKLLLLQQVTPSEVRDFFWAMAKYAKSEAKTIRFEGDFPELLATTYAGLKKTSAETLPQGEAPKSVQHAPAAMPDELKPVATPASDNSKAPAVSGAARKISRSDLSENNAEASAAEPPKLSPMEMMRKKAAEKAKATAETSASETPVPATSVVETAAASPPAEAAAAEPPKLSPIEMMRKKAAEKAKATAGTSASETPVPASKVVEPAAAAPHAEAGTAEPPKLSPIEMMRKKVAEKAKATAETSASETPAQASKVVEKAAASPQVEAAATEPLKLSPIEMMRKKAAEKAKATAETSAGETPAPATNVVEPTAASPQAEAAAAEPPRLSPLETMKRKAAEKAKATGGEAGSPSSNPANNPAKTEGVKPVSPASGPPKALSPKLSTVKDPATAQPATANRPTATLATSPQPTAVEKQLLRDVYLDHVRPFLAENRSHRSGLRSPLAIAVEAQRLFQQYKTALPATLHPVLEELQEFCEVRRQMELQRRILRWMHWWLMIHVPAAVALLIFLVAHIVMAIRIIPFTN